MKEPTAIHWHGIEVESYYDGVPWWGGIDEKRAPAVEPGKTFTVRMIPPRAGTFLYHTHWHDAAQLTGGVHGAMIVLASGQKYDPDSDRSFVFGMGPAQPYGAGLLLLNGSPQPAALHLKTGRTYRFRLINITPATDNLQVSLRDENGLVAWRELATFRRKIHRLTRAFSLVVIASSCKYVPDPRLGLRHRTFLPKMFFFLDPGAALNYC
jgi:FtsP/CotA-like multicopper oxidase with cupredoxin domain